MFSEKFDAIPTDALTRRMNLSTAALIIVCTGAAFGIAAGTYRLIETSGEVGTTTLVVSVLALLSAIPTWIERRVMSRLLAARARA